MRKDIPLHRYPKDVQIATHMIGLNYKPPTSGTAGDTTNPTVTTSARRYPAPTMRRCGRWGKRATS